MLFGEKMNRRHFLKVAVSGVVLAELGLLGQYADPPGFGKGPGLGRTKNSLAVVIAGIVARRMYEKSDIDLELQKTFFPGARITGKTTKSSIDTYVGLALTSSHFTASAYDSGFFQGEVEKSEFDWNVKQTSENTYQIDRFGPKFDTTLELEVKNGKITGNYIIPWGFDWTINGTYDNTGNVHIDVSIPLGLDITLEGKITERK